MRQVPDDALGISRPVRRLIHGLLSLTVLVQPGCMCGCTTSASTRRTDSLPPAFADRSSDQGSTKSSGECCTACSTASHAPPITNP